MKKFITLMLLITVVAMVSFQACSKDDSEVEEIQPNQPPVANAGNDTVISIAVCQKTATARLDGHLSYDPGNNNQLIFLWRQVGGPTQAFQSVDSNRNLVTVNNLVGGDYMFQLEVFDAKGLSSKDALMVHIINYTEYNNLDLDLTPTFEFFDNFEYYGLIYDEFVINGNVNISNESYSYSFYQNSDSAVISTQFSNYFTLYSVTGWPKSISGNCSVDFETLYIKGGGNFNGTIKITDGTAFVGCEDSLKNFPPIQVSGKLNAATNTIEMKLKGRVVL